MATFAVMVLTVPPPGENGDPNGAFVKIDGRESVLKAVELFLNRDEIKQVQVVFTPAMVEEGKRKYGAHLSFGGVKLATGGPKWVDQIAAAAEKLPAEATHVIVHDGARCAVAYSDIEALFAAAEKNPAVALTAPLKAPLVETDESGAPVGYRSADEFAQLLTPRVYTRAKLTEIVQSKQDLHASSMTLLKGSGLNVRASAADASLVSACLKLLPKPRIKPPSSPFEEAQW